MKKWSLCYVLLVGVCLLLAVSVPAKAQNWVHTWGGSQNDSANAVTADASGNVYAVGSTNSFGAGGSDVLILKYDSAGNLQWQKTWGGPGNDYGNGVAVDGNGNVYVTGGTSSFGAGWFDVFVLKFDSTGNLLWSKTWGGGSYDVGYDISLDASGNVYAAAESYSVGNAAILLKFDPSGNLLWSRAWKGPATYDSAYSVAVDSGGNALETGISWDYSVSPERNSILLLKYDSSGNLLWNRNWAGPSEDEAWASKAVQVDQSGNVYVAGREAPQCTTSPCNFGFLLFKMDPRGNFLWSSTWKGSAGFDSAGGLAFDGAGNPIITGVINAYGPSPAAALLNFDTSGNLLSSRAWAGSSPTAGYGLAILGSDAIVVGTAPNNTGKWQTFTGTTGTEAGSLTSPSASVSSPTLSVTPPAGTVSSPTGVIDTGGGGYDVFIASTSFTISVTRLLTIASDNPSSGVAVTVSPSDNYGQANGTTQFTRTYNNGVTVTLGAPATATRNNFFSWTGCESTSTTNCTVTMNADRSVTANYTQVVIVPPPIINSVSPDHTSRGQTKSITITGSNFNSAAQVTISNSGVTVSPNPTVSTNQITVGLDLATNATLGATSITVTNPDGQRAQIGFTINMRAVILIPGIMGSVLKNSLDLSNPTSVWPDGLILDAESIDPNDHLCNTHVLPLALSSDGITPWDFFVAPCGLGVTSSGATVGPTALIRSADDPFPELPDYYGDIAAKLGTEYPDYPAYHVVPFPYDWRLDYGINAIDLISQVKTITTTYDGIDIVAHSQGGLVARTYLGLLPKLDPNWQTRYRIGKIIFLGTPQRGAPKAYAILAGIDVPPLTDTIDFPNTTIPIMLFATSHFLAEHFEALYELMPRYPFYTQAGQPNPEGFDQTWNRLVAASPDASSFLTEAERRWTDIATDLTQFASSSLNGTAQNTLKGIQEITEPNTFWGTHTCFEPTLDLTGDGTVPTQSSSGFTSKDYYVSSEHSVLPANATVIAMVEGILATGNPPAADAGQWTQDPKSTPASLSGYTCSPVRITATDASGNVTGTVNGTIQSSIPNSRIFEFPENEGFFLPADQTINLSLQATANGVFGLTLKLHKDGSVQQFTFTDVPIAAISRASLQLIGNTSTPPQMQLDVDGDGIPDYVVTPNAPPAPAAYVSALLVIIRSLGQTHGNETQFTSSLSAALASLSRGDMNSASGQLDAFENKVRAMTGSIIPADTAPVLLNLAEECKNLLR